MTFCRVVAVVGRAGGRAPQKARSTSILVVPRTAALVCSADVPPPVTRIVATVSVYSSRGVPVTSTALPGAGAGSATPSSHHVRSRPRTA